MKLFEIQNSPDAVIRVICTNEDNINSTAIIFIAGFERTSSTEPKYIRLSNKIKDKLCVRLDFTGIGLSDGKYADISVQGFSQQLKKTIQFISYKFNITKFILIGHSLGGCIIAEFLNNNTKYDISKIILIAPALNQKELLRYYFVKSSMEIKNPQLIINWNNYKKFLSEKDFINETEKEKITRTNIINPYYFLENRNKDYSGYLINYLNYILLIHGDKDDIVPIESINLKFPQQFIVKGGNHDLEKPGLWEDWTQKTLEFI